MIAYKEVVGVRVLLLVNIFIFANFQLPG